MTNIWMLSKKSMKGLDLLEVTANLLLAFEDQQEKVTNREKQRKQALESGSNLFQRFIDAAETQISRSSTKDIFILKVTEELEKNLGLPPSELAENLKNSVNELGEGKISSSTIHILEVLSDIVMKITSRSVDVLSTPIY